ncbi:MAG: hypothetical protein AAGA48_10035 [Myxococcota bacterium]
MASFFATLLIWFSAALAAQPSNVGGRVDDGLVLDVTEEGLQQLTPAVAAAIPTPVEPGDIELSFPVIFGTINVAVTNLSVDVEVDEVRVTPRSGVLELDVDATVSVNSDPNPANLQVAGTQCNFYMSPFQVQASTTAMVELLRDDQGIDFDRDGTPDTKNVDVSFGAFTLSDNATTDDLQGCNTLQDINAILSLVGIDVLSLVLDLLRDELLVVIEALPAQLEPLIEEPFRSFNVAQEIDILGVPLFLALWPDTLAINSDGMRVGIASFTDAPLDPCTAQYGIDTYEASSEPVPLPPYPDSPVNAPHVVGFAEDDFANQALFATWAGGLLCLDLNDPENTFNLPLAIDSSLLAVLAPSGTYDKVFDEVVPISLVTDPKAPPVVDLTGAEDITVLLDPVGFVVEAEVAGRRSRVLDIEVIGRLGADLDFDGQSGEISLGLTQITDDSVDVAVVHNDFAPEVNADIEAGVNALLTKVAGPLLDEQLAAATLTLELPTFDGFGLQSLDVEPAAGDDSILGTYALVGEVPYVGASCTDGGGCDQGCTSGGLPTGTTLGFLGVLALIVRRRR